jgi:hypothetical protein
MLSLEALNSEQKQSDDHVAELICASFDDETKNCYGAKVAQFFIPFTYFH